MVLKSTARTSFALQVAERYDLTWTCEGVDQKWVGQLPVASCQLRQSVKARRSQVRGGAKEAALSHIRTAADLPVVPNKAGRHGVGGGGGKAHAQVHGLHGWQARAGRPWSRVKVMGVFRLKPSLPVCQSTVRPVWSTSARKHCSPTQVALSGSLSTEGSWLSTISGTTFHLAMEHHDLTMKYYTIKPS